MEHLSCCQIFAVTYDVLCTFFLPVHCAYNIFLKEILTRSRIRRSKGTVGKTRDFFKKIRDTKGTFHAKMGSIKDRNGMDLTEVEDIKKRWQEYTEELYKKDLQTQIITMV